ncbi:hypothetical protein EMIHUDRAFT_248850 [Emiliania huxleyi CCMP1516]|uniref:SAP domain-containing protein n=2 Tax=Emiliania huxleyi TaxID=2903 RepID=A0A0D3ICH3_EMIH1|nr:hypothetical protein EMIHUDRAFT_248850 [Emiliania huxleyi CCMP1516]EOD08958.1 hypothetical protein EMIHUDRAFT_248850 [Emiliania huxleyi CCMP1516]|eukprot:XP_005761387.1 hypothetical protein EMIHUDRAFT_248850 [Emiliania huxleyi CCMP1516]
MAELIALLRGTQLRSTAAANRAAYDDRLRQLEERLQSLKDQAGALAAVAFDADFALVAGDGTKVPARKQDLCAQSRFFKRMMEHDDSAEARAGEVIAKTGDGVGASAAALRHLMALLYGQQLQTSTESAVLLEICELATLWEFDSILESMSTMLVASAKASAKTACEMLVAALRHTEADAHSEVWKRLREASAQGVAEAGRKLLDVSAFADLDLSAICEAMTHVKASTVRLPSLEVDTSSERWTAHQAMDGSPTDQDLSWLLGATGAKVKARLGWNGSVMLTGENTGGRAVLAKVSSWVKHPQRPTNERRASGSYRVLGSDTQGVVLGRNLPDVLSDGKFLCGGDLEVSKYQRQYELFNLWLLASKRVASPLSPVDSLLCLRGCATGCDVDGASVAELQAMLEQRGLSTSGAKTSLQLRLRDAAYAEVPEGSAAAKATKAFAKLVARHYKGSAVKVKDLDAASTILDNTISWAQLAGRTDEIIAKVMPLVRWPLVPLVQLKPPLKALMKRCPVVKELVEEAIGLQMKPGSEFSFTPKRHRLMDGSEDTVVPRHKKRKHCHGDKVQLLDASALVAAMLPSGLRTLVSASHSADKPADSVRSICQDALCALSCFRGFDHPPDYHSDDAFCEEDGIYL